MTRRELIAAAVESEAPSNRRAWAVELLVATVFYVVVAGLVTWPLISRMSTGFYGFGNDNFGGVWNTGYLHDAFWGAGSVGFSKEAGFPWGMTMPLEAIQPIDWIYTIIFGGINDGIFAYNLQIFVGFVASGTSAYFATRWMGASRYAAGILGGLFAIVPLHLALAMQYQALSSLQFLPLAVVAFIAAARDPRFATGLRLGIAFGLVWWGSYYFGWFGIFVLGAAFGVVLLISLLRRRWPELKAQLRMVGGSIVGGGLLIGVPALLILIRIADDPTTKERALGDPTYTLAPPWSAFLPPHDNPLLGSLTKDWAVSHGGLLPLYEQANYTGLVAGIGALAGLILLLRRERAVALALLGAALMAFLLMLGPFIPFRFWSSTAWLSGENVPHIKSLAGYLFDLTPTFRYYGRAWAWGLAIIFVLAAVAAAALQRRYASRPLLLVGLFTFLGLFGAAEYVNRPPTHWVGTEPDRTPWVKAVKKLPSDAVIADYPIAGFSTPRSLYYQFWSSFHDHTTLAPFLFKRGGALAQKIEDPDSVAAGAELQRVGTDYVVVHTSMPSPTFPPYQPAYPDDALPATAGAKNPWLKLVGTGSDYRLYRVLDKPRTDLEPSAGWNGPGYYPVEMEGSRPARWMREQKAGVAVTASPKGGGTLIVPVRTPAGSWPVALCLKGAPRSSCTERTVNADAYTNMRLKVPAGVFVEATVETGAPVVVLGKVAGTADQRIATLRVAQPTFEPKR